jgi:lipopolysaccharide/colanic/teichoic acid biosynthesis glycosyltransferase
MQAEMTDTSVLGHTHTVCARVKDFGEERIFCDRSSPHSEPGPQGPGTLLYQAAKFTLEWVLALVLLILTAPLVLVLAALVKFTSAGPAFYSQTRLGLNGRHFRIIKLRTMTHDCEAGTGPQWSRKGDPRVTPIGRILRDTHLDELPQLFNVLAGHMSLIGPRPERPEIATRLTLSVPNYMDRLRVRPGITGLAQVNLPPDSEIDDVRRKLAFDLYYIRCINPLLDARIFVCTALHFLAEGASACEKMLIGSYGKAVEGSLSRVLPQGSREVESSAA